MTISSGYKNWVGVAKPTAVTVLKTKATAAATSVKIVTPTGVATTSSIVFLDGPNTETRSCTGGVTGTVVTVAALTHAHPKGCIIVALPTATFGPIGWFALDTFKVPDKIDQLYTTARVGSRSNQRGSQQGMRGSEWTMGGPALGDTLGYLLGGITGAETYAAGTPTPPNTHTFALDNAGNGQPTKLAWFFYDGVNVRMVLSRITKVSLKYTPKKLLTHSTTLLGLCSGVVATKTPSFSAVVPFAVWKTTITLATAFNRNCTSFQLTLQVGEAENIPTMTGTQDPLDTFVGALSVTAKATFAKTGDTILAKYEAGTLFKTVLTIAPASGATGVGLKVQMSKCNFDTNTPQLQQKAYNGEGTTFTVNSSTTDANTAGGGISPVKFTLKNAISSGVYL